MLFLSIQHLVWLVLCTCTECVCQLIYSAVCLSENYLGLKPASTFLFSKFFLLSQLVWYLSLLCFGFDFLGLFGGFTIFNQQVSYTPLLFFPSSLSSLSKTNKNCIAEWWSVLLYQLCSCNGIVQRMVDHKRGISLLECCLLVVGSPN